MISKILAFYKTYRIAIALVALGAVFLSAVLWYRGQINDAENRGTAKQVAIYDALINEAMKAAVKNQEKARKQYEKIYMDINSASDDSGACVLVDRVIDRLPNCKSNSCK